MMFSTFTSSPFMMNGFVNGFFGIFLLPLVVWSLFWKGWALWTAAKEDNKPWFVAILVLNTAGILEIIYLFMFAQRGKEIKNKSVSKKKTKSK